MSSAKEIPFNELPGDPSLILVTNVDLGDKKLDVMKGCSKAISQATGKPESYIGVSITDNASVIFGYVQYAYIVACHRRHNISLTMFLVVSIDTFFFSITSFFETNKIGKKRI